MGTPFFGRKKLVRKIKNHYMKLEAEVLKETRLPLTSDYVFKRIFAREENNCKHSIEKISEIADLSTEKVKKIIG